MRMAGHAVSLDERQFRAVEQRARALGTTTEDYVRRLIDLDLVTDQSFEQVLAPVRKGHLGDDELERLLADARNRLPTLWLEPTVMP